MPGSSAGALQDLRFLYLAARIEDSFEGLERAMERHIPAGAVREALQPIFEGGPGHLRLAAALDRLSRSLEAARTDIAVDDLLTALHECERMAESFYRRNADALSDPSLRELFLDLAREEARHAEAVRTAMAIAGAQR